MGEPWKKGGLEKEGLNHGHFCDKRCLPPMVLLSGRPRTAVPVEQEKLEMVVSLDNQIACLRSVRDRYCSEILTSLMNGSGVEPGVHAADVRHTSTGARQQYRLEIDGRLLP